MPSILTLHSEKYYTPKYNGNIEGSLPSKRYNKAERRFHGFSKRKLNSLDVFKYSVEKPQNTYTTQLPSSKVLESSYFIGSSEQIVKKNLMIH